MTFTAVSPAIADGPVVVFGGTFNPVHFGHLRSALELGERLSLPQVRLMPSARPALRDAPECSAEHRAAMVELALAGEAGIVCDRRELARPGMSYSVDSLQGLRRELGAGRSISLVLGYDALLQLNRWHRWRELLAFGHLLVIARPGWSLPDDGEIADWLAQHRATGWPQLRDQPCGQVLIEELRPLDIAASDIRALLAAGRSARYLLPDSVLGYIEEYSLYRPAAMLAGMDNELDGC
ncbi:MAG: nicotinate-nucleotide adenylyltransferase [Jhaorihella sp.]